MPAKATLTDLSVRALKAPARGQYTLWDKSSPIGIRISQGGSKTFIVMVGSGQRRVIGRFGVLTLAEARTEAKRILAEKTLGLNNKPSKRRFDEALTEYVEQNYKGKSSRTKHEVNRLLTGHFLPAFRGKLLSDLSDQDVSRQLDKLAHVPSEQLHAFRAVRAVNRRPTLTPDRRPMLTPSRDGF